MITAGSGLVSALAGCSTDILRGPTVREARVLLQNGDTSAQTFQFALEIGEEVLEWNSRTLDAEAAQPVTLDTPSGAIPIAFHGKISDAERTYEFDHLDRFDQDICLFLSFDYMHDPRDDVKLTRDTQLDCP